MSSPQGDPLDGTLRSSRAAFAAALIGIGILGLIYGNACEIWESIPKRLPGRPLVVCLCSLVTLAGGVGLLLRSAVAVSCRVVLALLLLWLVLLKLPPLLRAPQVTVSWESFAETAALSAGAWCLFAARAGTWAKRHLGFAVGPGGITAGRLLLIAALPMIGVSHFVYHDLTASLVPKWLGFPLGWTYLTGAASIAAAAGMLFAVVARLAVSLEAAMLWIFTLLVWVPRVAAGPRDQGNWSEILISAAIASGAWLVADTYRGVPWLAAGRAARAVSYV
ncbi:MAG TPA: hypothetical protein VEC59_08435 [Steroidobacteraceae bacterium]|nr:hypothetical protein [Steroidobacteraceae bacterium]